MAKPDERWTERPLACVVLTEGASATADELRAHLAAQVPKWWLPDAFAFIDEVPEDEHRQVRQEASARVAARRQATPRAPHGLLAHRMKGARSCAREVSLSGSQAAVRCSATHARIWANGH